MSQSSGQLSVLRSDRWPVDPRAPQSAPPAPPQERAWTKDQVIDLLLRASTHPDVVGDDFDAEDAEEFLQAMLPFFGLTIADAELRQADLMMRTYYSLTLEERMHMDFHMLFHTGLTVPAAARHLRQVARGR